MNQLQPSPPPATARELAEARFAGLLVARLNEDTDRLDGDIGTRLRFAREQALEQARLARPASAAANLGITAGGAALLGRGSGRWVKLASLAPLAVLVFGLVLIQQWQTRAQISVAAEVDAALLSDDLPPSAYSDAGFVEFLKSPPRE
ncbi:MAG: DUF3619 family protein [Caldimonas sp.]